MAFSWDRGQFNTRGSFNRWFRVNVTANGWPTAYHPAGFDVNFEYPDVPLRFPSISVTHMGGAAEMVAQGHHLGGPTPLSGQRQHELTDISIWASGQANSPWVRDLMQSRDLVAHLFTNTLSFDLLNVYATTAVADLTAIGIARIDSWGDAPAPLEASPNIHRQRMLVRWSYMSHL